MNSPTTLADKQREIVRACLAPLAAGLSAKARASVADHEHFLKSISTDHRGVDEIDRAVEELAADPIHDHAPAYQSKHKVNRVLSILDELDRGTTNRRFTH